VDDLLRLRLLSIHLGSRLHARITRLGEGGCASHPRWREESVQERASVTLDHSQCATLESSQHTKFINEGRRTRLNALRRHDTMSAL
jgi:hypothetical protein